MSERNLGATLLRIIVLVVINQENFDWFIVHGALPESGLVVFSGNVSTSFSPASSPVKGVGAAGTASSGTHAR